MSQKYLLMKRVSWKSDRVNPLRNRSEMSKYHNDTSHFLIPILQYVKCKTANRIILKLKMNRTNRHIARSIIDVFKLKKKRSENGSSF